MSSKNDDKKIYKAVLHINSGEVSADARSFTYEYLVITDHDVTAEQIYNGASRLKLPVVGSVFPGLRLKVTSVSLDRWNDENMSCVPTYNLPKKENGSYASWKYTVKCDSSKNEGSSGGNSHIDSSGSDKPTSVKEAQSYARKQLACNYSVSSKTYTITTNYHYEEDYKRGLLKTPAGTYINVERTLINPVISFTYYCAARSMETDAVLLVDTVNLSDEVICGFKIEEKSARIESISFHNLYEDVYDEEGNVAYQEHVTEVNVSIEIFEEYNPAFPDLIWTDFRAKLKGAPEEKKDVFFPICELIPNSKAFDVLYKGSYNVWFSKDRLLGAFEGLEVTLSDKTKYTLQSGIDYNYVTERCVLDKDGYYYTGDGNLEDKNIGKIEARLCACISWSQLHLPVRVADKKVVTSAKSIEAAGR